MMLATHESRLRTRDTTGWFMDPGSSFSSKASDSDYGSSLSSSRLQSRTSFSCGLHSDQQSSLVSLISEISCTDSDSLEQLERENAHFTISESLIQVFEEMKWLAEEHPESASRIDASSSTPISHLPSHSPMTPNSPPVRAMDEGMKQWIRFRGRGFSANEEEEDSRLPQSPSQSSLNDSDADVLNCSLTSQSFAEQMERLETTGLMPMVKNWGISLSNTSLFSRKSHQVTRLRLYRF